MERIGKQKTKAAAKPREKKPLKQTKLSFKSPTKSRKPKARNPWSESSGEEEDDDDDDISLISSDSESNYVFKESSKPSKGTARTANVNKKPPAAEADSSVLFDALVGDSKPSSKPANDESPINDENGTENNDVIVSSDSEGAVSVTSQKKAPAAPSAAAAVKASSKTAAPKASSLPPKKKPAPRKKVVLSSDEDDDDSPKPVSKKPAARKPSKRKDSSDSEEDFYDESPKKKNKGHNSSTEDFEAMPRARNARARPAVSYKFGESDDEEDDY